MSRAAVARIAVAVLVTLIVASGIVPAAQAVPADAGGSGAMSAPAHRPAQDDDAVAPNRGTGGPVLDELYDGRGRANDAPVRVPVDPAGLALGLAAAAMVMSGAAMLMALRRIQHA
jgi:hypothetical protein